MSSEAPYIFIKHRSPEGTILRSVQIVRYWKHKPTGIVVEIRKFLRVVPDMRFRVVFFDASMPIVEQSMDFEEFKKEYEPVGNFSSQY
jgi:hypothetical protein